MNPEAKEVLQNILAKNPQDLTLEERAFLCARRSYLNDEQKRIFASVLAAGDPFVSGNTQPVSPNVEPEKTEEQTAHQTTDYTKGEDTQPATPEKEEEKTQEAETTETNTDEKTEETTDENPYDDQASKDPDA